MSRWADWFPITREEAEAFMSACQEGDEAVQELLEPWLERIGVEGLPLQVQIDKSWEPIHRSLTGDRGGVGELELEAVDYPLNLCVLGGAQLLEKGYRSASLVRVEEVPDVADALARISKEWFRERFFSLPDIQFHEINEDIFEWTWEEFQHLPPFFTKAAAAGNAVICTISH
jgi:hypothetical protein